MSKYTVYLKAETARAVAAELIGLGVMFTYCGTHGEGPAHIISVDPSREAVLQAALEVAKARLARRALKATTPAQGAQAQTTKGPLTPAEQAVLEVRLAMMKGELSGNPHCKPWGQSVAWLTDNDGTLAKAFAAFKQDRGLKNDH